MTKRRFAALLAGAALLVLMLVGSGASADDSPIHDNWPEEVPTPWFCTGTYPVDVCVPPE